MYITITSSIVFFASFAHQVKSQTFEPCSVEGSQICRVGGYQICAHHDATGLTFGPVLSCGPGTTCFPASNGGILCRPISDLLECPFETRRCFDNTSFQQCNSFPRGTFWGAAQPCETGRVCQNGECFVKPPVLPACVSGNMQCATATTFRVCDHGKFGPQQPCPKSLECKPEGNFIRCDRPGLI